MGLPTSPGSKSHLLLAVVVLAAVFGIHAQESFVQVYEEPKHLVKLKTDRYRVYEVLLKPGEVMLYHEHKADSFTTFLSQSEVTNDVQGGAKTDGRVKPGIVSFAAASPPAKSYVHRVVVRAGEPLWLVNLEILHTQSAPDTAGNPEQVDPALVTVRESPRGRGYRLNLEPDQTARLPSRVQDLFIVCLSDGSLVQQAVGQSNGTLDCRTGAFRLLEKPGEIVLKNHASARVDLAIVAVH